MTKDQIEQRTVNEANYIVDNNATVRETAKQIGVSKSTVHKDVTKRLSKSSQLYFDVLSVLNTNKSERHIRGGNATKRKYANAK